MVVETTKETLKPARRDEVGRLMLVKMTRTTRILLATRTAVLPFWGSTPRPDPVGVVLFVARQHKMKFQNNEAIPLIRAAS